eukprot:1473209-Prymnesium_polylepis.1
MFFDELYFNNGTDAFPPKEGCGTSIHGCGQVIGSMPATLAYTTGAAHKGVHRLVVVVARIPDERNNGHAAAALWAAAGLF